MPITVPAYAAIAPDAQLEPIALVRRDLRADDLLIDIEFSGICHSDIHTVRGDWGGIDYPLTPGHEIVGRVVAVGSAVSQHAVGDRIGIGCLSDSCGVCEFCQRGWEHRCVETAVQTYGGRDRHDGTPTQGGYAAQIVVREDFAIRIPESIDPAAAAPLLCAGITVYSPLRRWGVGEGSKVAVIGLGGLGHVAVQIAAALGAEVTAITQTSAKAADAERLGAVRTLASTEDDVFGANQGAFDVILNTVSADLDLEAYLGLLRPEGALVEIGLPTGRVAVSPMSLAIGSKALAGSNIGGIPETQEMIDFCAERGIAAEVEVIPATAINDAFERVIASDVRYRFVIDATTFGA